MKVSTILTNSLSAAHTPAPAPIAPVVAVAPVTFRMWVSKEPRLEGLLTGDVYAPKSPGYVESLFAALEAARIEYRTPGFPMLVKVYSGKVRVNTKTVGHVLTIKAGESITAWLDRVAFDERTTGIAIEIPVRTEEIKLGLTKDQVKALHRGLGRHKFEKDALISDGLISSFTFIAPPTLAKETKQFVRTVAPIEHVEAVALPVLRVPAGHVEPAAPIAHAEFVGDAPTFAVEDEYYAELELAAIEMEAACAFPVEPQYEVLEEELVVDSTPTIIEIDSLDARAHSELKALFLEEFGYNSPINIKRSDLIMLIDAKRDSSF